MNIPDAIGAEVYRRVSKEGGLLDLAGRVKLRLTGADRVRYLNGQASADVRRLSAGQAAPACILTAKGKLCAEVMITAGADALFVDAAAVLRESLPARLDRYIIADDVLLEDVTEDYRLFHAIGKAAEIQPPEQAMAAPASSTRVGRAGCDWWIPNSEVAAFLSTLPPEVQTISESLAELLRIEAGAPRWGFELDENTLPPEAGLDRTHIDYHKGCYIGQEVISRIKSVGHVNRRLTGFISAGGESLEPAMRIVAAADPEKQLGALTSAAWSFALERPIALGYLRRGSPAADLLAVSEAKSGSGIPVTVQDLPFTS